MTKLLRLDSPSLLNGLMMAEDTEFAITPDHVLSWDEAFEKAERQCEGFEGLTYVAQGMLAGILRVEGISPNETWSFDLVCAKLEEARVMHGNGSGWGWEK